MNNLDDYDELGMMAAHSDTKGIEEWLHRGKNVDVTDEQGMTILFIAIMIADFDILKLLVSYGANINTQRNDGLTPLMQSVISGGQFTRWLVEQGADVALTDNAGRTALDHAILWGRQPSIKYLSSLVV